MAVLTFNSYCTPSRRFVQGGRELTFSEGITQGDSYAIPIYLIGIILLLNDLKDGEIKLESSIHY